MMAGDGVHLAIMSKEAAVLMTARVSRRAGHRRPHAL